MKKNLKVFNLEIFNLKVLLVLFFGLFCLQVMAFGVNDSAKNNNIYLFRAAKNGDLDWVKKLVEKYGADVNYRTNSGKTVLIKAVTKKHKKVVKYLLLLQKKDNVLDKNVPDKSKNKNRLVDFDFADNNGQTALHKAAKSGEADIVKILVDAGADKNKQDRWGNTPLHIAAKCGFVDVIKELLAGSNGEGQEFKKLHVNLGESLEIKNNKGNTPVHEAAKANYKSVVELLMQEGANINTKNNNGRTPFDDSRYDTKNFLQRELNKKRAK